MASFYKRKNKNGTTVIRIKGYPTVCKTDHRKQELLDWAQRYREEDQKRSVQLRPI